jgi:membrane protein DedA with SNARE-associated domain
MREQILAALSQYGSPILFAAVAIAAIGLPLPVTLLLIVTGALVSQGAMNFWLSVLLAGAGSVIGDQIGYAIGRWGGVSVINRFSALVGGPDKLQKAESTARQWGGAGVFFTRWLLSPIGPAVNLVSGTAGYPWTRFLFWDVLGEFFGVVLYILLGRAFSDRVVELSDLVGEMSWTLLALLAAVVLGWKLFSYARAKR